MNPTRCIILAAVASVAVGLGTNASPAQAQPAPGGKPVVAVLPFTSPAPHDTMGRNAQSTFVTALVKARKVRVVQATMVQRMLRRHGLQWTGALEPRLLKAAGRFLKADYLLAGKLRWGGDAYILSAHVMNVRTLETTMAEDVDFMDAPKMRVAVRVLARKIAGQISGTGSGSSKADLFLNVDPRAFYDTSDACIHAMGFVVDRFRFTGTVDSSDEETRSIRVKGYVRNLRPGIPLDVFSTSGIDGPQKVAVVHVTKLVPGGFEARYRMQLDEGIELGAKVTNRGHRWTVAVGKIDDEAEDNAALVRRFRSALLEKISEGTTFQQIEGGATDWLAKASSRRSRFTAFRKLYDRGIDLVLEGKLYGASGSRRAHFKIYSTMTGKLLGEPKFETQL